MSSPSEIPDDLLYTADHEWVRRSGATARVGLTDFAQQALGDVVFVSPPEVGAEVAPGGPLGEVESTKSVSDVYAPVAGTVVGVNDALVDTPDLLNSDPYGAGWLADIEAPEAGWDALMDAAAYRTHIAGQA